MTNAGEYGGRVLRTFEGGDKKWIAGAILTPADVASWPYANKLALHNSGKIDWFGPPVEEEAKARAAGSPAPKRGQVGAKVEPKASVPTRRVRASN